MLRTTSPQSSQVVFRLIETLTFNVELRALKKNLASGIPVTEERQKLSGHRLIGIVGPGTYDNLINSHNISPSYTAWHL